MPTRPSATSSRCTCGPTGRASCCSPSSSSRESASSSPTLSWRGPSSTGPSRRAVRSPDPHRGVFLAVALLTQLATVAEVYVAEDLGWRTTNSLRVDLTAHSSRWTTGSTPTTAPGSCSSASTATSPPSPASSPGSSFTSSAARCSSSACSSCCGARTGGSGAAHAFSLATVAYLTRGGGFVGRGRAVPGRQRRPQRLPRRAPVSPARHQGQRCRPLHHARPPPAPGDAVQRRRNVISRGVPVRRRRERCSRRRHRPSRAISP